ncbi:hypothetical protein [Thioalkalivibrio sp. ALE16]|uniref:hypothetical protein n=1 Tax=Thioalkalivibrio sp. ALE16 TaxID=1158172 RepID=UPI000373C2F5|nr:hypothetical protein [Thioalkalivibrio sp. ALE16]
MSVLKALAQHTARLLTFRHNGDGLPRTRDGVSVAVFLIAVATALAMLRWGVVQGSDHSAVELGWGFVAFVLMAYLAMAFAYGGWLGFPLVAVSGYAIISSAIDTVMMAIILVGGFTDPSAGAAELILLTVFVIRAAIRERSLPPVDPENSR